MRLIKPRYKQPHKNILAIEKFPIGAVTYIIHEKNNVIVVDPGQTFDSLLEGLSIIGKTIDDIDGILITHFHNDHIWNVKKIQDTNSKAITYAKGFELPWYASPAEYFEVNEALSIGDKLNYMGGIEVIGTPGHTPCSISFYLKEEGILFSGDALQYRGGKLKRAIWLYTMNSSQEADSIRRISRLEIKELYPGHRKVLTGDDVDRMIKEYAASL